MVIFASFLLIPVVINSVTPLVNYGSTVQQGVNTYGAAKYPSLVWAGSHPSIVSDVEQYSGPLSFASSHPAIVATATADSTQIANAARFAPELAVIKANPVLFAQAAKYKPTAIPPALAAKLVKAAAVVAPGPGHPDGHQCEPGRDHRQV